MFIAMVDNEPGATPGDATTVKRKRGRPRKEPILTVLPAGPSATLATIPGDKPGTFGGLRPRERLFIEAYAGDPTSPTYGNGTRSAAAAGYGSKPECANQRAMDLLKRAPIRTAVSELLERTGLGTSARASILHELANKGKQVIDHYDGNGTLTQRQVVDNDKVRLAAVREAAKLSGDYRAAEDASRMNAKVLEPLITEWNRRLRAMVKAGESPNAPPSEAGEDGVSVAVDASDPLDGSSDVAGGDRGATGQGSAPTGSGGSGEAGGGGLGPGGQ